MIDIRENLKYKFTTSVSEGSLREFLGQEVLNMKNYDIGETARAFAEHFAIYFFGYAPHVHSLEHMVKLSDKYNNEEYDEPYTSDSSREIKLENYVVTQNSSGEIDYCKTVKNIENKYEDIIKIRVVEDDEEYSVIFNPLFVYYGGMLYTYNNDLPDGFIDCIAFEERNPKIKWILRTKNGNIDVKSMDITPKGNIDDNYNDDFIKINERVNELIRADESCIIILHGKPGTGKTTYIRDLITSNSDINFYWVDSSMFNYMDSYEFVSFLGNCKNAIFILEDSESLLKSRDSWKNGALQSLLSISDGLLGDSLRLKFICTFNTDLMNIDKAILRKGRLKLKYEFKNLCVEKVRKLFNKLGLDESEAREMPLCDVYNFMVDNGNENNKPKIGFSN